MRVVTVHEAKTQSSRLLEDVRAGEQIIVAKGRVPYALLVPLPSPKARQLGFLPLHVPPEFFRPLPAEELDAWDR